MTSLRIVSRIALALALSLGLTACPGMPPGALDAGCDGCGGPPDASIDVGPGPDATPPPGPDAYLCDGCGGPPDAALEDAPRDAFAGGDAPISGNAFIARDCGPADGFALRITISDALDPSSCSADPLRPSTMFYVHDLGGASLPPTPGATITSSALASSGTATECPGGTPPCRLSEEWSITFATYSDTGGATGQFTVTWPGGEAVTGTFVATRCESGPVICG